jgi:hypothetical protein
MVLSRGLLILQTKQEQSLQPVVQEEMEVLVVPEEMEEVLQVLLEVWEEWEVPEVPEVPDMVEVLLDQILVLLEM